MVGHVPVTRKIYHMPLPEDPRDIKVVYSKAGTSSEGPWYGFKTRMPAALPLDAPGDDNVTTRYQLLLQLGRMLEDADGRFRYQEGDELNCIFYFDEVALKDDTQERWDAFVRAVPPRRDSPQQERGIQ